MVFLANTLKNKENYIFSKYPKKRKTIFLANTFKNKKKMIILFNKYFGNKETILYVFCKHLEGEKKIYIYAYNSKI